MNLNNAGNAQGANDETDASTPGPDISRAHDVIAFWKDVGPQGWFVRNDDVDRRFEAQFSDLHFAAARRECDHWMHDAAAGLALIILLDQFPRNVFRGTAHMFATDPLARRMADRFIDQGLIGQVDPELRKFACLPFIHSEDSADQARALQLYKDHAQDSLEWAEHHNGIIKRFGRFPHRNASLGRDTTPAEQAFLDEGGFRG